MQLYDNNGYANIPEILDCGQPFMFVVGGRGTGKTYGALKYVLDNNITFMLMRRTQAQVDMINKPEFSPFKALERDTGVLIGTSAIGKSNAAFYRQDLDEDGKRVNQGAPIGYTCALSTISNLRGFDAGDVELVIYDEFIPEAHERPLKHEGAAFLNAYETINRNRELQGRPALRVLCMANANDMGCPIFDELGLIDKVDRQYRKGQEVKIYDKMGVAVFLLKHSPISNRKSQTALYRLSAGSEYYNMAVANAFGKDDYANVGPRPLGEYKIMVKVGDVCIYKHKARREFYACRVTSGRPPVYSDSVIELAAFRRKYPFLWFAVLDGNFFFADFYSKTKVLDIFT